MVKWVIAAVLVLPVAEITTFVLIAAAAGTGWTITALLAASAAGLAVLHRAGRRRIARLRVAVADNDITAIEANTAGFLIVLAGLMLFLPGFLTGLAGAALLIAPVRRRVGEALQRAVGRHRREGGAVVDLAPDEWRRETDPARNRDPPPGG
jgi:UPF0716 protein FxsA